MKLLFGLFIIIFYSDCFAQAIFFSPSLNFTYASGGDEEKSSLIGTGFGIGGGIRYGTSVFEIDVKRNKVSSGQIGSKDYDTTIYDTIFSGGFRLILNEIFSIKAGLANHYIEMDIYESGVKKKDLESDGEYLGFYGGMGILHQLSHFSELYLESTLYPLPDVDMYFVDMQFGLRWYL